MRVTNPDGHMTLMSDAIEIMKVAANRLGPGTNDEIKAFGNYVVSKMNSFSTDTRKVVEHAIIDILMKADKGFFWTNPFFHIATISPNYHPTFYIISVFTIHLSKLSIHLSTSTRTFPSFFLHSTRT